MTSRIPLLMWIVMFGFNVQAVEQHVAVDGNDANSVDKNKPLKTIQRAAVLAQPGDVITVHEGLYRERINPPRGGESEEKRIVYQAAKGEKVEIRGSEQVKGWEKVRDDVWKVTLPNSFFGKFNPFGDLIGGNWFDAKGRPNHTGAVYLNGEWLMEAASLEEVMQPAGKEPLWFAQVDGAELYAPQSMMNLLSISLGSSVTVRAENSSARNGTSLEPCPEGGKCAGYISAGKWLRFDNVDFGTGTESVELRAAAPAHAGGDIELRLEKTDGELLGVCEVTPTGGWQKWQTFSTKIKRTSGLNNLCLVFKKHNLPRPATDNTTIWAQFKDVNPNDQLVEINVRQTVFYPDKPGRNYITVKGFTMRHAATPWAPPTAEQIGLIGVNWSKGWIIENNVISHSKCSGITLGKYGDAFDNRSSYEDTISRALKNGWNRETTGHHIVRNNVIYSCEQTGICGSLGAAFSTITGNVIHDIHVHQLFGGFEMGGIKLHAPIDSEISRNHIYRSWRGIWLDWMTQGTRVTANLLHDNGGGGDLLVEVNHGPFIVDNNLFLSESRLFVNSQGGAYAHNLFMGPIDVNDYDWRKTPYHKPHSTEITGMTNIICGDDRYYNNIFLCSFGQGKSRTYDAAKLPVTMHGNVYLGKAVPGKHETQPLVRPDFKPAIKLIEKEGCFYLEGSFDRQWSKEQTRKLVTTELLGKTVMAGASFEKPDGGPVRIDTDYFGKKRNRENPFPGPVEIDGDGPFNIKVW